MEDKKKDIEESVEAVPGPRISITQENYEKMKEDSKTREKKDQPKSVKNLFAHIKRKKQMKNLPFIARVDLSKLQKEREEKAEDREISILASADFTKRLPKIRLYYISIESFKNAAYDNNSLSKTYCISSPFYLPTGMTIEDACKVVSYLSKKVEREHNLEPASIPSVSAVSRQLGKYGFEKRENHEHGYHHTLTEDTYMARKKCMLPGYETIEGVTDLYTVGGDFKLFKKSDLYDNYFDWFTEGVSEEEVTEIYKKIGKDYILEDVKESSEKRIMSELNFIDGSKIVTCEFLDKGKIIIDEDEQEQI